jgi:hypothetical protein
MSGSELLNFSQTTGILLGYLVRILLDSSFLLLKEKVVLNVILLFKLYIFNFFDSKKFNFFEKSNLIISFWNFNIKNWEVWLHLFKGGKKIEIKKCNK